VSLSAFGFGISVSPPPEPVSPVERFRGLSKSGSASKKNTDGVTEKRRLSKVGPRSDVEAVDDLFDMSVEEAGDLLWEIVSLFNSVAEAH
jgi:hypothetical protein